MKVVIIVVHLTLLFNFSISNFLIIHWKELINLYRLDEGKYMNLYLELNVILIRSYNFTNYSYSRIICVIYIIIFILN